MIKKTLYIINIDEELCWDNLSVVLDKAKEYNNFIRLDMENSEVTDSTIEKCKRSQKYYPKCGTVLQAYMKRTLDDIALLKSHNTNIRLCKGAYKESEDIAYQDYQEIRNNYMESAEKMMDNGIYIGLATHDNWLIEELEKLIEKKAYKKNMYEFQALSGVPIDKILE